MTKDSNLKRQIRARMALTAEPYNVARRAVLGGDDSVTEEAVGRMFDAIEQYLSGKGRWLVPHGFEIVAVKGRDAILRLPVIWEPVRGALIARASGEPSTTNLDELRALIEDGLRSGQWLPGGTLVDWSPTMPDGPRPGDLWWTVTARIGR